MVDGERNQRRRRGSKELGREGAAADDRKRGGDARRKEAETLDERRRWCGEVFIAGRDRPFESELIISPLFIIFSPVHHLLIFSHFHHLLPWNRIEGTVGRFEKHPEKESYRKKCVPYYDELCVIFGDDQATGGNAITGNEANIELPSLEEMCNAEKSLPTKEEKDEVNQSSSSATRTGSNGQRTKRKKSSNIDATEQGLTTAANRLADAFAHTDCARLEKELHNIPELSREDVMRAMLLLGGEVKDANIFFHLDEDLKKD
ncbi:hypothetical protein Syun_007262 [Stephania yunnanensis]|uniref:Uncharacterized protein n=1 Tax=Stephania yunnanensis TaxID=152371 RepID=A0AAP0KYG1_9MAGN